MARLPTSEAAKRLHALFRRRPGTEWSEKEVRQFRVLVKAKYFETLDDLTLLERYYAFERKKGDQGPNRGCHRRDLYTLLNRWGGEMDRAREWSVLHPLKKEPRKIIPLPPIPSEPYVPPTDAESLASLARFEQEREQRKASRQP